MRIKNGFFSISLIYSFFLVFALITAVLLANYAHNRLLSKDFNSEIKIDLDNRGDIKLINLHNKIQNSSFEADSIAGQEHQWSLSNVTFINSQSYHSNRSVSLNSSGNNTLTQQLSKNVIKKSHKYYFQYMIFSLGNTISYDLFEISIHNSSNSKVYKFYTSSNSNFKNTAWEKKGYIVELDETINENDTWYIMINKNGNSSYPLYLDAFVLVDLTKAYGYEEEPLLTWLNNNIEYFEINYIHQRSDYEK